MTDDTGAGTGPEDQELERLVRASLDRRAEEMDTAVPVVARARTAARRRRTTRVVAGAGALAVAAALVTAVVVDRSDPDPDGGGLVVDTPSPDPLPSGWRTEYWHDTQVDVPDDCGWGTAPSTVRQDGQETTTFFCGGPGAAVLADGTREGNADASVPYVGRPIMLSDMCVGGVESKPPSAPYVWLGAAIEPGIVDLGDGWVQETREVNGSTVTVGTDDERLRERILGSATGGETCLSELEKPPTVDSMLTEGMGTVRSGQLCVYRDVTGGGKLDLVYARDLSADEGERFAAAAYDAPPAGGCRDSAGFEYAVVTLTGDDPYGTEPVSQDFVVDTHCSQVETSPGEYHELTEANVRPWAGEGVGATMVGPTTMTEDGWVYDYFIGMLG
jgi:hypothetical protein